MGSGEKMFKLVTLALIIGLLVVTFFYFGQSRLLFFPERLPSDFKFSFGVPFHESNLELSGGQRVVYLKFNSESKAGTILFFRGNAGSLRDWGHVAAQLAHNSGWSVWIMDYPGSGKSTGSLPKSEKILIEMGEALKNIILETRPNMPLVLFGRSIGSAIATTVTALSQGTVDGLVLETPYRSISRLGREIYPFLPAWFSRYDLDNERWLSKIDSTRVLIIHGTADHIVPFEHGKFLSKINSNFRLSIIEEGGHNNLSDFSDYWLELRAFLKTLTKNSPQ
jgi:uncharacterized protein